MRFLLSLLFFFGQINFSFAQFDVGFNCEDAVCLNNSINLTINNQGATPTPPLNFSCGVTHNNLFFSFSPESDSVHFTITPSNCLTGLGVQTVVYETNDCRNFTELVCISNGTVREFDFVFRGTPGGNYILMIDGFSGDICDFQVIASGISDPADEVSIPVPDLGTFNDTLFICEGNQVELKVLESDTSSYFFFWEVKEGAGNIAVNYQGPEAEIFGFRSVVGEICVVHTNFCVASEFCFPVRVLDSEDPSGYCTRVTGAVFYDVEQNNCSSSHIQVPNAQVSLENDFDGSLRLNQTDESGRFDFAPDNGNYLLSIGGYYAQYGPSPEEYNIEMPRDSGAVFNFCLIEAFPDCDLSLTAERISTNGWIRPGDTLNYKLNVWNRSVNKLTGDLIVHFTHKGMSVEQVFPDPQRIDSNFIVFSLDSIPILGSEDYNLQFIVGVPGGMPDVNGGEEVGILANLYECADHEPGDYTVEIREIVRNAYDPNNKIPLHGETIKKNRLQDYFYYRINFENIGTAPARDVIVKDKIDNNALDLSTFELVSSSHKVEVVLLDNELEFIFDDIELSHEAGENTGYLTFRIKPNSNAEIGDEIRNKAEIYFDLNPAIITNDAITVVVDENTLLDRDSDGFPEPLDCDDDNRNIHPLMEEIPNNGVDEDCDGMDGIVNNQEEGVNVLSIFPNPVHHHIHIEGVPMDGFFVSVYDINGKLLLENRNKKSLDLSGISPQVLIIKISDDDGSYEHYARLLKL